MIKGLEQAVIDLQAIASEGWIAKALRDSRRGISDKAAVRYDAISRTTRYSPGYIGKRKPSGRSRAGIGDDAGYALDTGAMVADMVEPRISGTRLTIGSEQAYAGFQEALINRKFATGESRYPSFFDDQGYGEVVEAAIYAQFD